ncbi:PAS domain-containing protein [Kiloniella laminariae]|uniref:PAS domain-containing protein n=1 Tax=Kiloniella laminariae TaxID=454162 RepID=A0ABT4LEU7_9PROT|nr:PAS domain-containing protein [Kiloniella laminariae]MCZ4279626.1 PAS domain-containing protein [Kiloniella laminariae]
MFHVRYPRNKIYDESFLKICDPKIRAFYEFYCSKKQGRSMPERKDFDPIEMKQFLPGITLVDVDQKTGDFTYRLVGTGEVTKRGNDPTGKLVRDHFHGDLWAETEENYLYVCKCKSFIFDQLDEEWDSGLQLHDEVLFLPLSNDDNLVNMVMLFCMQEYK